MLSKALGRRAFVLATRPSAVRFSTANNQKVLNSLDGVLEQGEFFSESLSQAASQTEKAALGKSISDNFASFASEFGVEAKKSAKATVSSKAAEIDASILDEFDAFADELISAKKEELAKPKPLDATIIKSSIEIEVGKAFQVIESLRAHLHEDAPIFKLTRDELTRDHRARKAILNRNKMILKNPLQKSTEKEYASSLTQKIDEAHSFNQSNSQVLANQVEAAFEHNQELVDAFGEGEEGVDYTMAQKENDPYKLNIQRIKSDVKKEINRLKLTDPVSARKLREHVLKRTEVDEAFENKELIEKIVKIYPGSSKGPLPEDDPEFYTDWFMRNQPKEIYTSTENPHYRDIGVKHQFIATGKKKEEDQMIVQSITPANQMASSNELYPNELYDGCPEFDIAEPKNYKLDNGLPFLRIHTPIQKDEMLPVPPDHTLNHTKIHYELERWNVYRQLPTALNFYNMMNQTLAGLPKGHFQVPDYLNEKPQPSLWAYYETLPSWARNHPIVKNAVMAIEYHQPWLSIREKEQGLNFACSFLRPIDTRLRKVLADGAASHKVEINMKTGTEMMNELPFYRLKAEDVGTESEDFDGEGGDDEDTLTKILRMRQEQDDETLSPMQAALKQMSEDNRYSEMEAITEADMNVKDFEVEPETTQCMTDFYTFDFPELDDIESQHVGDQNFGVPAEELPVNYYDNDDGYWDEFIQNKHSQWEEAGIITNRKFFIH